VSGDNVKAIAATVKALRAEGRLGDVDKALVAMAETSAAALDLDPGNAALLREYRQTLMALLTAGSGDGDDDTRAFLLAVSSPVRYGQVAASPDGGRGSRSGGGADGSPTDAVAADGRRRRSGAPRRRTPSVS
jgi:hypothetical protein